jgi:hypothetical protein
MKKVCSFLVVALLVLSLASVALADDTEGTHDDVKKDGRAAQDTELRNRDSRADKEPAARHTADDPKERRIARDEDTKRPRIRNVQERSDLLKGSAFRSLGEDARAKLERLNTERLEHISTLDEENIAKIHVLAPERLRVIASESREHLDRIARMPEADVQKLAHLDRMRINEIASLSPEDAKARLARIRLVKADEHYVTRELSEGRKQRAREHLLELETQQAELHEHYSAQLDEVKRARERLTSCQSDGEDCAAITTEALDHSRDAALHAAERIETYLLNLQERIASSEDLSEDKAQERNAQLDDLLSQVTSLKDRITEAATKDELNAAVGALRDIVKKVKKHGTSHGQSLARAQVMGVVHRSEILEKKIDCTLAQLEADGVDTAAIDDDVDAFSGLLAAARGNLSAAKPLLGSNDTVSIEEGKELVGDARDAVHEAQQQLVVIKNGILRLGGTLCAERQEVAIEEGDDE